jgi:hypothetical protein
MGSKGLRPRGDRAVKFGFDLCLQQNLNSRVGFLAERHRLRGARNRQYCQDCQQLEIEKRFFNQCESA